VAAFRFSRRAEADLLSIGDYTLRTWSKTQAARYLGELEVCCQTLSDNPALGRLCDEVRPGLRRLEHGKHVVFYRQERGGILVSRILHQGMLPELHSTEDQDHEKLESVTSLALEKLCPRLGQKEFWVCYSCYFS